MSKFMIVTNYYNSGAMSGEVNTAVMNKDEIVELINGSPDGKLSYERKIYLTDIVSMLIVTVSYRESIGQENTVMIPRVRDVLTALATGAMSKSLVELLHEEIKEEDKKEISTETIELMAWLDNSKPGDHIKFNTCKSVVINVSNDKPDKEYNCISTSYESYGHKVQAKDYKKAFAERLKTVLLNVKDATESGVNFEIPDDVMSELNKIVDSE